MAIALLIGAALCLGACALVPAGPSNVAPRQDTTTFTQYRSDDRLCRGWATRKIQDEDALTDSLQSGYDAAYLRCMSAEQVPAARVGVSTFFPPAPPGLIPPIGVPDFSVPPPPATTPSGSAEPPPPAFAAPSGVVVGPG